MPRLPMRRTLAFVSILVLAGACGVGGVKESTFVYGAMGVEGGTVETEEVTLQIPPGALAGPTTIAILPEVNPLPIQPPVQDPCEYALLGAQYCCGPVGLELLEDGRLAVTYDETLIPDGVDEEDLVLLLWDDALQALVPAGDAASHDAAGNVFVVDDYQELGHLAVGYSTCPQPGIVFLATTQGPAPIRSDEQSGPAPLITPTSGLWLVSADNTVEGSQLPTDGVFPSQFLPAPDGRTVMYEMFDYESESYGSIVYGVSVADGVPSLLAGDDEQVEVGGRTVGWMRDGRRVFFLERVIPSMNIRADILSATSFSTVPGDASAPPTSLYEMGEYAYPDDVRQSPDGSLVMVVYYGQFENQVVDVFNSSTGAPVSQEQIPFGGGQNSPRFLPDSSGLYLVDSDRESVDRYDPDGSSPANLFTPPAEHGALKDFVLAPNGDDYAYIGFSFLVDQQSQALIVPNVDVLYIGSLSGGLRATVNLGSNAYFRELIFHPDGQHVFLDSYDTGVRMFAASDGAAGPVLQIPSLAQLDISGDDGRLLLVVGTSQQSLGKAGDSSVQPVLAPGLYVADADGQNQQLVTTPAGLTAIDARWLRTIRRAPCMGGSSCFR